jgi:hypothetical protein
MSTAELRDKVTQGEVTGHLAPQARFGLPGWLEWMELEIDNVRAVLRHPAGAMRLLDAAVDIAHGDLRDGCLSLQAVIALFGGDLDTAERSARGIAARSNTLPEIRARALLCLVAALSVKGDTVEAVHRAEAVQAELTGRPGVPAIWRAQLLFSLAVACVSVAGSMTH